MKERAASHHLARCPKLGISALEKEVADLYLPLSDDEDAHLHHQARDASVPPKPFAAFGSFRQRHGDAYECNLSRTIEAPAKLESSSSCLRRGGLSQSFGPAEGNVGMDKLMAAPVDCPRSSSRPFHSFHRLLHKGKSCSTDLDREEAWERKKEQYLLEEEEEDCDDDEEYDADEGFYDALSEHASEEASSSESDNGDAHDLKGTDKPISEHVNLDDVGQAEEQQALQNAGKRLTRRMQSFRRKPFPRSSVKPLRTKSLTDEDLEELRGSIDLGFGFSYSERCKLTSTLPALELYYAINKNYVDAQSRSSPVSPLEGNALLRTNSAGSTSSPSSDSWRISSPGDHPSQVKTRLRHWAQAVACSVKQGY